MSRVDRDKWNARYQEGAYAERRHPSPFLERRAAAWLRECCDDAARAAAPRALDVACGTGRNAIHLAALGFEVDGVDISEIGLEQARARAAAAGVCVAWHRLDLDDGLPARFDGYDLIAVIRFLHRPLLGSLPERLSPGGILVCEVHLETEQVVAGPPAGPFRAAPGELVRYARGLVVRESEEWIGPDPDGRPVALARLVAQRAA
jgi:tellurite methyltransferase